MVDRQIETNEHTAEHAVEYSPGAVVVDFDGTVIRGNSLRWFLREGLRRLLRRGRLPSALVVGTLIAMRKLHLISHETMKYGSLRVIGDDAVLLESMRRRVKAERVESVMTLLDAATKRGDTILVATAASESYVRYLCNHLGIGENVIASPFGGPDLKGKRKRDAVIEWLAQRQLKPKAFFTDHPNDLPTAIWAAEQGATIYLVNPSEKHIARFNTAGLTPQILN